MLYGAMTHPELISALGRAGHGTKILIADGNYPFTTGVNRDCEQIFLNLAPGLLTVSQVLEVLKETIPIEGAEIMVPASNAELIQIPAHVEYRAALPQIEFREINRFDFYQVARQEDVQIVIATGDQRLYANLLLTIGVRNPEE